MIQVDFICSPQARQIVAVALQLPDGATLLHAMRAALAHPQLHCLAEGEWDAGIWGRRQSLTTVLKEGDRIEAYRPLRCDPKEARRLRYRQSPRSARRPVRQA